MFIFANQLLFTELLFSKYQIEWQNAATKATGDNRLESPTVSVVFGFRNCALQSSVSLGVFATDRQNGMTHEYRLTVNIKDQDSLIDGWFRFLILTPKHFVLDRAWFWVRIVPTESILQIHHEHSSFYNRQVRECGTNESSCLCMTLSICLFSVVYATCTINFRPHSQNVNSEYKIGSHSARLFFAFIWCFFHVLFTAK